MIFYIIRTVLLLSLLIISAFIDIKTKKIPNQITFSGIGIGLLLLIIEGILSSSYVPFLKTIIWLVLLFLFGMTKLLGLGDIKLIMALITISGPITTLFSVAIAAFVSIILWLCLKPKETINNVRAGIGKIAGVHHAGYHREIAFAPYLLIGMLTTRILSLLYTGINPSWF